MSYFVPSVNKVLKWGELAFTVHKITNKKVSWKVPGGIFKLF